MHTDSYSNLPDPQRQSEFYEGVTIKRFFAWVIDFVIVAALMVPVLIFTFGLVLFILPFAFAAIGFAYRVVTLATGSATWGMRMMAIEFRDIAGQRFDLGQAFMHTLGYTLSLMIAPLQLVSIICMLATERGQGLTDMVLNTVALNRRA